MVKVKYYFNVKSVSMKENNIYTGPNGLGVWICQDHDIQPFLEVSMGCFQFHMNLETLNCLLEGLSKAWYEIHKDNHACCGCGLDGVKLPDNPFDRKWEGEP